MTILAAVSFFDDKSKTMGYALASDRKIIVESPDQEKHVFQTRKAIMGDKSIALYSGGIHAANEGGIEEGFRDLRHLLMGKFDHIRDGELRPLSVDNYDNNTTFLIACREGFGEVRLLTLNEEQRGLWRARQLHRGTRKQYFSETESLLWHGPIDGKMVLSKGRRLNPIEAQSKLLSLLANEGFSAKLKTEDVEEIDVYFINLDTHRHVLTKKIKPGQ